MEADLEEVSCSRLMSQEERPIAFGPVSCGRCEQGLEWARESVSGWWIGQWGSGSGLGNWLAMEGKTKSQPGGRGWIKEARRKPDQTKGKKRGYRARVGVGPGVRNKTQDGMGWDGDGHRRKRASERRETRGPSSKVEKLRLVAVATDGCDA